MYYKCLSRTCMCFSIRELYLSDATQVFQTRTNSPVAGDMVQHKFSLEGQDISC